MAFAELAVLVLEGGQSWGLHRRIRDCGGLPVVVAAAQAVPEPNRTLRGVLERLIRGEFDAAVFTSTAGTRVLFELAGLADVACSLVNALRSLPVIAGTPRVATFLRRLGLVVEAVAPPPHRWGEVVEVTGRLHPRALLVNEYGRTQPALERGLRRLGAEVTSLRLYEWCFPADAGPLRQAVTSLAAGAFPVVVFTEPTAVVHAWEVARAEGLEREIARALRNAVVGASGAETTELLAIHGVAADVQVEGGYVERLVERLGEVAAATLERKRRGAPFPGLPPLEQGHRKIEA